MKLTRAAEYGVRCVLYLAQHDATKFTARQEIANATNIPTKFLAKIAQELAKGHVIEIRQGAKGGYRLTQAPDAINMLQVVEIMMGKIALYDCTIFPERCNESRRCAVRGVLCRARKRFRETLETVNFAELAEEENMLLAKQPALLQPNPTYPSADH